VNAEWRQIQVAIAQRIGQVPTPAEEEDIFLEAVSFEVDHRPDSEKFGVKQVTRA
jgi:hypothetical protein